jgi:hypothetical protein
MSTQRKDKAKVLGESFDDARIKTFLNVIPRGNLTRDFCALEKAYRGMGAENFATFVQFFVAEGLNVNATNEQGETFLQILQSHRHSEEYQQPLIAAGAKTKQ